MSWIKDNKFMVALGGGSFLGAALLFFTGLQGAKRYDEAKEKFDLAAQEVASFDKAPLSPKPANRDGKSKALAEYRQSLDALQAAFEPYRPKGIKNITPQEFTTHLLAANAEVRKAFEDAGTTLPESFFLGFENYKTTLAAAKTTGTLDYQLTAIKNLMLALAKAKPTALKNLHRPSVPEEENPNFTPPENATSRPFPLEITFTGPEKSLREFLSSIAAFEDQFVVVRSLRITNDKKDPPKAADAKFDKPVAAAPAGDGGVFGGGFVLPGEGEPAKEAAEPTVKAGDSSRILAQVLGNEQVQVFLRLDVLQFLPARKLP